MSRVERGGVRDSHGESGCEAVCAEEDRGVGMLGFCSMMLPGVLFKDRHAMFDGDILLSLGAFKI